MSLLQFLTKHGHDCRQGDHVEIKLTTSEVVVLPTHSYGTKPISFRSSHTTACVLVRPAEHVLYPPLVRPVSLLWTMFVQPS
jgi:hypothetical protein